MLVKGMWKIFKEDIMNIAEKNNKSYVGTKFFRYLENGYIEVLRVLVDKNPECVKCLVEGSNNRRRISLKELKEDYTKLTGDGVIYFNIVKVGKLEDVMVLAYRYKDIEENNKYPYVVCRQNITDIFANTINPDYNNLITGLAVSMDSLPEKVPMDTLLACDELIYSTSVVIYMDDTLSGILSMIKTKQFDNVLFNLYLEHIKYKYKYEFHEKLMMKVVDGYVKNLQSLMEDNEFMFELYRGFGIIWVTFEITEEEIEHEALSLSSRITLSPIIMKNMSSSLLIPFDKSIDLSKIERDYLLLMDSKNKLYVVAYTYSGEVEIPVADIENAEGLEKLSKIPGYDYVKNVVNFSGVKYQ